MTQETFDNLIATDAVVSELEKFTEEQLDAVIVQMAVIARSTTDRWALSTEQCKLQNKKFMEIMETWPKTLQKRFTQKVLDCACPSNYKTPPNRFWDTPADAVLTALNPKKFI